MDKNPNIKCEFCLTQLIDESEFNQYNNNVETKEINISQKKVRGCISSILSLIFVGPWLMVGIIFFPFGLVSGIYEYKQAKGYEKTIGLLIEYNDNEAIYEYHINGDAYTVSPKMASNLNIFAEQDTVYYNPNNPSESIIYSSWNILTIVGFIIVIVVIVILISKKRR